MKLKLNCFILKFISFVPLLKFYLNTWYVTWINVFMKAQRKSETNMFSYKINTLFEWNNINKLDETIAVRLINLISFFYIRIKTDLIVL